MATCPRCGSRLAEITASFGEDDVTMRSCSACGFRTWVRDGETIDVREVLDLTAETHKSRRRKRQEAPHAPPA